MTPVLSDRGGLDSPDSIQDGFFSISRESSRMDCDMDMDDDIDVRSQPPALSYEWDRQLWGQCHPYNTSDGGT